MIQSLVVYRLDCYHYATSTSVSISLSTRMACQFELGPIASCSYIRAIHLACSCFDTDQSILFVGDRARRPGHIPMCHTLSHHKGSGRRDNPSEGVNVNYILYLGHAAAASDKALYNCNLPVEGRPNSTNLTLLEPIPNLRI